jgi:DNA-binding response OmpR family regulator
VILLDARMPAMSGYEAAKRIRARSDSALAPIIFMTDFGGDETETAAAYAAGAVDFLFAPIADDALRAKVTTFIDLSDNAREHQDWLDSVTALNASFTSWLVK